ncbi:DUF397 domain-containing protein [Streptomyces xiaopingdaonensis]
MPVRDSKWGAQSRVLVVPDAAWAEFTTYLRKAA